MREKNTSYLKALREERNTSKEEICHKPGECPSPFPSCLNFRIAFHPVQPRHHGRPAPPTRPVLTSHMPHRFRSLSFSAFSPRILFPQAANTSRVSTQW